MYFKSVTREQFCAAISTDPRDKFAKTFVRKADMLKAWDKCIGLWENEEELLGAEITTLSKRLPLVANLQLLHVFAEARRKGAGRALVENSMFSRFSGILNEYYYRVSSEKSALPFYKAIGFVFHGIQKSGTQLAMCRIDISSPQMVDWAWDDVIRSAIFSDARGGCLTVFAR